MALSGRAALPRSCPLWLKQTKVTSLRAFAWEKSPGRLGCLLMGPELAHGVWAQIERGDLFGGDAPHREDGLPPKRK
jgi:hypothetical protein